MGDWLNPITFPDPTDAPDTRSPLERGFIDGRARNPSLGDQNYNGGSNTPVNRPGVIEPPMPEPAPETRPPRSPSIDGHYRHADVYDQSSDSGTGIHDPGYHPDFGDPLAAQPSGADQWSGASTVGNSFRAPPSPSDVAFLPVGQ